MNTLRRKLIIIVTGLGLCGALAACSAVSEPEAAQPASTFTPPPIADVAGRPAATPIAASGEPAAAAPLEAFELGEPQVSTAHIAVIGQDVVVANGQSTLTRMTHGVYMTFDTRDLVPGEAVTIWWVIFNRPENCSDGVCGVDDMALVDADGNRLYTDEGAPRPNLPQREATQWSLLRATGAVVDVDGTAEFRAHLPVGDAIEAEYGPGLLQPMTAEIHLIARTHGMAIPGAMHDQLNSAWGGCPDGWPKDPCRDVQVAIHSAAP